MSLSRGRFEAAEMRSLRTKPGATIRYQKRIEGTGEEVQNNNVTDCISDYRNKSLKMLKERHKLYPERSAELSSKKKIGRWKTLTD